jgi:HSP20 family molecular chaperone IbpA
MSRDKDDNNPVEDFLDMVERGLEVARDHEDTISRFVGGDKEMNLTVKEPLAEAQISDDEVVIVAEARGGEPGEMNVRFGDGAMHFSFGGNQYKVDIPDDVIEDSVDAQYNNGVLRVTLDRMNEEESTQVEVEDSTDESIDSIIDDAVEESNDSEDDFEWGDEDGSDG